MPAAAFRHQHLVEIEVHLRGVEPRHAGIADRGKDTAQIRVGGEERGLHQRRMRDGVGDLAALRSAAAALDAHRDELGGAFAVAHDGLGELLRDLRQRRPERLQVFPRSRDRALPGCEAHERVIRRGVPIHGDGS